MLGRIRRGQLATEAPNSSRDDDRRSRPLALPPRPAEGGQAGWDHTARPLPAVRDQPELGLRARILSLFADPRVETITIESAARVLDAPRQDIETTLDALLQAGELIEGGGATRQFRVAPGHKQHLEAMFRDAAQELGASTMLMHPTEDALSPFEDGAEEPRLPVTAGLLSLFLPGTGQLLNGDVGRASLVFAVWSLAWITHLSPVWTFVCLYAGAEAFFTAKIRSMERKMAKESLAAGGAPPAQLPPAGSSSSVG